ncbi:MAG: hypothetical protein HQK58_09830 [Deltaproteobacteria bacterium]|nr:hypothetical protein [Deltaproteobacteria bacterium]
MKKWRFWLGLITLFISGVAIGAAGTAIYIEHRIKHALEGDASILTSRMFKKLSRELRLTEKQRAKLSKTVSQAQCDLLRVRARSQPEIDRIINYYINLIKPELTPEQQQKVDIFYQKAKRFWARQEAKCQGQEMDGVDREKPENSPPHR